jgi:predicted unusual protein kinase regulating ubiquinone biosynthesis (AarF/ABC1/UbiB family)
MCVDVKGNLVFYDYGLMDSLGPNVRSGFRKFCTALFAGGPQISDPELAKNAKLLVNGVEEAGVLAKGADRLAVEKLARYFMRTFKDKQLGKKGNNIKETIGTDLQTLTENNVFRFPSTFTFIFRAFASVDGIGKKLDPAFDIGKLAQPSIEKLIDSQKGYRSDTEKTFNIFQKATGLNVDDIETAVQQPRKVKYIEETLRSIEDGSIKIRVRSLENEKSLERMGMRQTFVENILIASVFVNVVGFASRSFVRYFGVAGASFFFLQSFLANTKIKKFDKTQLKFEQTSFATEEEKEDY